MRFCDLFISYKIGLKSIKSTIPFTKLPLYRKIFVIILFASAIISGILLIFKQTWASYIPMALGIISLIIFFIIDSMKRNLKVMLQQHYAPYSEKRMNMTINVLKDYGIEIQNFDSLDMLIEEAKQAQIQCDYIAPLKKPFPLQIHLLEYLFQVHLERLWRGWIFLLCQCYQLLELLYLVPAAS